MTLPVPRIEDPWQQRKPVFIAFGIIGILLGLLWIWGGVTTGQAHPAHILRVLHDGHGPVPPPSAPSPSTPAAPPVVTLYGKVVDEAGAPIPDAEVSIEFRNPWQSTERRTTSPDGTFSIHGYRAGMIQVEVKKPGYSNVQLPSEGGVISTADLDFKEDSSLLTRYDSGATPLVLTLWQPPRLSGPPTNHQLRLSAKLDPGGRPRTINVRNPAGGAPHAIELQYRNTKSTGPRSKSNPHAWNLIITVPGGTLIEKDPAQVKPEAPATGYLPRIEIDFPATPRSASWQIGIYRHYYIQFPDNTYGVLSLRFNSFTHTFDASVIRNFTPGDRDLFHPIP